ncbi:TRAP transporter large permease subunit, partial [Georgenia sp. 10Sc9-8]|nr:TRAP transporter large permease subunit [Georgenia halotolerans]
MVSTAFILLLILMASGIAVALALSAAGFPLIADLDGSDALLTVGEALFRGTAIETYAAVPLFVLLGEILIRTRMAENALFAIAGLFSGRRRSLLYSALVGCGVFSAISGSSVATGATVTRVMWPSMATVGIAASRGLGTVAAGATLGLLIPPSLSFIIYGSV